MTNFYWASDLLHRLLHIPKIGEGVVEHYAEDYAAVVELAKTGSSLAVRDSEALQLFALEAYAYDVRHSAVQSRYILHISAL